MRILADYGVVEDAGKRRGCIVRWIASPKRIRTLLEEENGTEETQHIIPLLEGLFRASAGGERRHLRFSRREIARWCGGDFAAARDALDSIQRAGVLGWRDEGRTSGYLPANDTIPSDRLPVNWGRVAARRTLELSKLKRMESYAYQRSCRRRYLLRYFGEDPGRGRCDSCDRCG
jgi:ATP-dependent DNA helicase RecQ